MSAVYLQVKYVGHSMKVHVYAVAKDAAPRGQSLPGQACGYYTPVICTSVQGCAVRHGGVRDGQISPNSPLDRRTQFYSA